MGSDGDAISPPWWDEACAQLAARDAVLRGLIECYSGERLQSRGAPFTTLARSVIGQQISVKAAASSARKVEYLRSLAQHFSDGRVHIAEWPHMSDAAIAAELTAIRGIGQWTADMFLIFHLLRPNVLPLGDVGLLRAISQHYARARPASRTRLAKLQRLWRPWCSAATWYMWRSLDPLPVAY